MAVAGGKSRREHLTRRHQGDERDTSYPAGQSAAISAREGGAGEHEAILLVVAEDRVQAVEPRCAPGVVERDALGHSGLGLRRVLVVAVDERHVELGGQEAAHGGLSTARDAHDHDQRAIGTGSRPGGHY